MSIVAAKRFCSQIHIVDFPVLTCIVCDVLAIPGVSISVEWLFFKWQTHDIGLTFRYDSRVCIKDCGCKGVAEKKPQGRNQLS